MFPNQKCTKIIKMTNKCQKVTQRIKKYENCEIRVKFLNSSINESSVVFGKLCFQMKQKTSFCFQIRVLVRTQFSVETRVTPLRLSTIELLYWCGSLVNVYYDDRWKQTPRTMRVKTNRFFIIVINTILL